MELQAKTDRVLMSDVLKDKLADDSDPLADLESKFVTVVAARTVAGQSLPLVGTLQSVLFDPVNPEIEFKVELSEAFDTVEANALAFNKFELHHGERVVDLAGPFDVKAARIQEVDVLQQLCVLALQLQRKKRA